MPLATIKAGSSNNIINGITIDNPNGPDIVIEFNMTCVALCDKSNCTLMAGGAGAYCKKCALRIHSKYPVLKMPNEA